jgi:hypothetical protein
MFSSASRRHAADGFSHYATFIIFSAARWIQMSIFAGQRQRLMPDYRLIVTPLTP